MSDSIKTTFPTFDTIKEALCYLNALGTAAETHGLLCALFATGAMLRKDACVAVNINTKSRNADSKTPPSSIPSPKINILTDILGLGC